VDSNQGANPRVEVAGQTYAYDQLARLKSVTTSALAECWPFDPNGNGETHTWGGATDAYVPAVQQPDPRDHRRSARSKALVHEDIGNKAFFFWPYLAGGEKNRKAVASDPQLPAMARCSLFVAD